MSERIIELESCWEETQPPREFTIKNNAGMILLKATIVEPTWAQFQTASRGMRPEEDVSIEQLARLIVACVGSWNLERPISAETMVGLHPLIFNALAEETLAVVTMKANQLKNSGPPSQPNGLQPSNERAGNSAETKPNITPTES